MKGTHSIYNGIRQSAATIILVPLSSRLIVNYLAMFSPIVREYLGVSSIQAEYFYLLDCLVRMQQGETLFYCIVIKENNQLIGAVEIRCIPYHASHIYTWINEMFWGRGYFKHVMRQATNAYFSVTKFPFVIAHIDIKNKRSYRAFKSCGFSDWGFCMGARGKQFCLVLRKFN